MRGALAYPRHKSWTRRELDALEYRHRHPGAADVLWIAEVADTTYNYDTRKKGRLYARAGFEEYLVLDLSESRLIAFRSPRAGAYAETLVLRPGETFYPLHAPERGLPVAGLLGKC